MGHEGIESCNIRQAKLAEGVLEDGDSGGVAGLCLCVGIDCFHDFINVGGDQGVCAS